METPLDHWWECKLVQLLWKTVWRFFKKLKIQLPYDPAILGISPDKTIIQKDICTPMFIAALFTKAKTWKQSKCPSTDKQIEMWHEFNHKKNEIMPFEAVQIDLEIIIVSSSEREMPYDITYMWNLKYRIQEMQVQSLDQEDPLEEEIFLYTF